MNYTQLNAEYKYDTLADAIYAREIEHFHYDFDRKNFEYLIANATDNEFAANVAERLNATRKQMDMADQVGKSYTTSHAEKQNAQRRYGDAARQYSVLLKSGNGQNSDFYTYRYLASQGQPGLFDMQDVLGLR